MTVVQIKSFSHILENAELSSFPFKPFLASEPMLVWTHAKNVQKQDKQSLHIQYTFVENVCFKGF